MSRIPLAEAGRRLHLHPLNLLVRLRQHGCASAISDCWPQVDEGFVETVRHLDGAVVHAPTSRPASPVVEVEPSNPAPADSFTAAAKKVVEKMWRKGRWGKLSVSSESLHKMCQEFPPDDIDAAIQELVHAGLVESEGQRGPWSLDTGHKAEIERIATSVVRNETARKPR